MVIETLQRAIKEGRLAHALLFSSSGDQGQNEIAIKVAQSLICDSKVACGTCAPCRRVLLLQSENLQIIEPDNGVIKIESVRQVLANLSLQNWSGERVVLIKGAEQLNLQAANAALKVIEEPPEKTYFLLTTASLTSCLMTIRSRCQIVRIPVRPITLNEADIEADRELSQKIKEWVSDLRAGLKLPRDESWRDLVRSREDALKITNHLAKWVHSLRLSMQGDGQRLDKLWRMILDLRGEIEGQLDRTLAMECFWRSASEIWR